MKKVLLVLGVAVLALSPGGTARAADGDQGADARYRPYFHHHHVYRPYYPVYRPIYYPVYQPYYYPVYQNVYYDYRIIYPPPVYYYTPPYYGQPSGQNGR
jgi:hypothetical protein